MKVISRMKELISSKSIYSRAPLRLGLAGGGTDVSPYCDLYGGFVLNTTIDRYAYTVIKNTNKKLASFKSIDQKIEEVFDPSLVMNNAFKLKLHAATYKHMMKHYNNGIYMPLKLITCCDAPIGSGLGSSSTIVVSMIKAFVKLLNLSFDHYKIAQLAYIIERIECKFKGGRQDHYAATFGGINLIKFYKNNKVLLTPLKIKNSVISQLESSLVLYFTGVSRDSEKIIDEYLKNISEKNINQLKAMHFVKAEALVMKKALLTGNFPIMINSMRKSWYMKKKMAKKISNNYLDIIYKKAIKAGALAGKISGAGGGGFMLFYVPLEKKQDVKNVLTGFGGIISNCHLTKNGCEAWSV
jgi:D-glycero-alpha-D-manno-heptose-7-phosphate kinase